MSERKIHYAWLILLACCILQGLSIGIVVNCAGLYYIPVSSDFACKVSDITMYVTIKGLFTFGAAFFVRKFFFKLPLRLIATIAVLSVSIPFFLMGLSNRPWHWYICGMIQGVACVVLNSYMVPIVLRNWFHKRLGFAFGLVTAFSGLSGVVMSAICGHIISMYSWRHSICFQGFVMLVLMLPCSMLLLRLTPEEKNVKAYGFEEITVQAEKETTSDYPVKFKIDLPVILFALSLVFCGSLTAFGSHFAAMGRSLGVFSFEASLLISIHLAGNSISKLLLGSLNDSIGAKKTTIILSSVVFISSVALLTRSGITIAVAVFFFGFSSMVNATQFPLIAKSHWTKSEYPSIMQVFSVLISISYSFFASIYGYMYDRFGDYNNILKVVVCFAALDLILLLLLFKVKKEIVE